MGQEAWNTIRHSKSFYVRTYRKTLVYLIISLCISLLLSVAISYVHLEEPEPDFYATSGIIPPIMLTPLAAPNNSDTALLSPDPINDEEIKVIPQ